MMRQRFVGRCSNCSGEVYGERQFPFVEVGIKAGDHCVGCGATAATKFCAHCGSDVIEMRPQQPVAPGVAEMQAFSEMARRLA